VKAGRGALLLLLCCGSALAQSYRWTDSSGRTVISDSPPPPSVGPVSIRGSQPPPAPEVPYAVRQAAARHPVTLYTAERCVEECRQAREHLTRRGVPFTEKRVSSEEEVADLKQRFGEAAVPSLQVGRQVQRGFSRRHFDDLLDAAGYPSGRPGTDDVRP
jgi:glutaredoxin